MAAVATLLHPIVHLTRPCLLGPCVCSQLASTCMHVALLGQGRRQRRRQPQLGIGLPIPPPAGITNGTPSVPRSQILVVSVFRFTQPCSSRVLWCWHERQLFLAGEVSVVEECTGRAGQDRQVGQH
jgi:hypothetical protein